MRTWVILKHHHTHTHVVGVYTSALGALDAIDQTNANPETHTICVIGTDRSKLLTDAQATKAHELGAQLWDPSDAPGYTPPTTDKAH